MNHSVPLSKPPADWRVPEDLKGRFWYDAARQKLCFDGFMSKCMFDRLEKLSRDAPYLHALDELFRLCVPEDAASRPRQQRLKAVVIAVVGLVALGGILAIWRLWLAR